MSDTNTNSYEESAKALTAGTPVLIAIPEHASVDSVAASLGLRGILDRAGVAAHVVCAGSISEVAGFLPGVELITHSVPEGNLTVSVATTRVPLEELSYVVGEGVVTISLKASGGSFDPADISVHAAATEYPVIAVVGAREMQDLGGLLTSVPSMHTAVKVSFSNQPQVASFAPLQVHDIRSLSLCELVYQSFGERAVELLDADTATCLLAGLVFSSNSFQHPQVTPHTLELAARLMDAGARQQEIVRYLYKTKPLRVVKLWGRAAARLEVDTERGVATSQLTEQDFERSGASSADMPAVAQDLASYLPELRAISVAAPVPGGAELVAVLKAGANPDAVLSGTGGEGVTLNSSSSSSTVRTVKTGVSPAEITTAFQSTF